MTTDIRVRLAECARRTRKCDVRDCYDQTQAFGKYCQRHDRTAERTGHPQGRMIRACEVRPYSDEAKALIEANLDNPAIQQALAWIKGLMDKAQPPTRKFNRSTPPHVRLDQWLCRWRAGRVDPLDVLSTVVGVFALQEEAPRLFRGDRQFNHVLAVRVLRRGRHRDSSVTQGGWRTDEPNVALRDYFAERLKSVLGLLAMNIAKELIRRKHLGTPKLEQMIQPEGTLRFPGDSAP